MRCLRCGEPLSEGAAFCPHCGAPVARGAAADETRVVAPAGEADETSYVRYSGDEPTQVGEFSGGDETRVSRRREETVLAGETTLLDSPDGADGPGALDFADDRGLDGDGLDVEVPPPLYAPAAPTEPPAPEPKPRRTTTYIFIAIAACVVAAVLGAFITWRLELWGGVSVPDVMGMGESEATAELTEAGFEVSVSPVVVDEGAGTVVSMQPQAGRRVALGRTVEIGVGVERAVPDLVGLSLDEAREKLTASGIEHTRLEYQNSEEPKGTVIAVSPVAGTKVAADDVVTVVIAQPYTVPDVLGLTEEAAVAALERAGLDATISYVPSDEVDAGRVVATDPVAGTELREGHGVEVSVSSPYPKSPFDLAGFMRFKPEDVSKFLSEAGFSVSYAKNVDGILEMAWRPMMPGSSDLEADGLAVEAVGFSPLPFSIPNGIQLFPRDLLREGMAPLGACLAIDSAGSSGGLELTQDCVTRIMNLCGLRSEPDATTAASKDGAGASAAPSVAYVAKASAMDDYVWYVVIWEDSGAGAPGGLSIGGASGGEGTIHAMAGMAGKGDIERSLEAEGITLDDFDGSLALGAATLVLQGQGITLPE